MADVDLQAGGAVSIERAVGDMHGRQIAGRIFGAGRIGIANSWIAGERQRCGWPELFHGAACILRERERERERSGKLAWGKNI